MVYYTDISLVMLDTCIGMDGGGGVWDWEWYYGAVWLLVFCAYVGISGGRWLEALL